MKTKTLSSQPPFLTSKLKVDRPLGVLRDFAGKTLPLRGRQAHAMVQHPCWHVARQRNQRSRKCSALAGRASSSAKLASDCAINRTWWLAASFWSVAAECRAKRSLRSLQPGTPFPRSLPTRRWFAARLFFPAALSCCAGRLEQVCDR